MALPELPKEIPGCAAAPAMPSAPGALVAGSLLAGLAAAWRRRRR
jgi:MYXO-CTERM domain-containing protein